MAGKEEVLESPWRDQAVRVTSEASTHLGRVGHVSRVYKVQDGEDHELHIFEASTTTGKCGGVFTARASHVERDGLHKYAPPGPETINWRLWPVERRRELHSKYLIKHVEKIKPNQTCELGGVFVMMGEIHTRLARDFPEIVLIEPAVAVGISEMGDIEEDAGGETKKWIENIKKAQLVLVCVRAEPPPHYTYLEIQKHPDREPTVRYKDSLKHRTQANLDAATRILQTLKIAEQCPEPENEAFQEDGWSCGCWVARWCEARIRAWRGEAVARPCGLQTQINRANIFIEKLQPYPEEFHAHKAKRKAEAAAKSKAICEETMKAAKAKAAKIRTTIEPTFENLEDALKAGEKCKKCQPTKAGTKGCRSCMGEWFEHIRQGGHKSALEKLVSSSVDGKAAKAAADENDVN